MGILCVKTDLLIDTLDRYNLDMVDNDCYKSDFRRFVLSSGEDVVEVFVSIAYGIGDSKLIAEDIGCARFGGKPFVVGSWDGKLDRFDVDVKEYTSFNSFISELGTYYIV